MALHDVAIRPPDVSGLGEPAYANVAHVSATPYDFRLTFSLLTTPHEGTEVVASTPTFVPRAVTEVVLPAAVVPGVIDLLRAEFESYVSKYGRPDQSARG
jgi:hypothetical protein